MKISKFTGIVLPSMVLAFSLTACKNEPEVKAGEQIPSSEDSIKTGKLRYSFKQDGRSWKVVNDDDEGQARTIRYILAEEEPENATELFSLTEMSDINITPPEYFSQFITELQKRYTHAKVESKVINQETNSLLGEWWIDGTSPDNTHHEWIRILKKGNDIAILRYSTIHTNNLEKTRKIWESILSDASFN